MTNQSPGMGETIPEDVPYENKMSIEELRAEVRLLWDQKHAFDVALNTLPEVPPTRVLWFLSHAGRNFGLNGSPAADFDLMAIARELQAKHNTSDHRAVPYKTELELAAGLWSIIRAALIRKGTPS